MRPLFRIAAASFGLLLASQASATVTISIGAEVLADRFGTAIPTDSLVILVASTTDTTFAPLAAGTTITTDSFLGGTDDRVLWMGDLSANGTPGLLFDAITTKFTKVGDALALIWLPTHSLSSVTLTAGDFYGIFSSPNLATSTGDTWTMKADGSAFTLNMWTTNGGNLGTGELAPNVGFATSVVIPETSTYAAILGALTLGVVGVRRWRKSAK